MEKKEINDYTGVTTPTNGTADSSMAKALQKGKEEDIVAALLEAADFRNDEGLITPVEIKRNGKILFSFKVRPVSDGEAAFARKKARKMIPNPAGKKLPRIEGEFDAPKFNSWLIYVATVDEDKERVWGQKAIMDKYDLMEPWETVGIVLTAGEKNAVVDVITDISGMSDEAEGEDDGQETPSDMEGYAKN